MDRYGRTFWDSATPKELVSEQGVVPIQDIADLAGDIWPDDEDPDDFILWLRQSRSER